MSSVGELCQWVTDSYVLVRHGPLIGKPVAVRGAHSPYLHTLRGVDNYTLQYTVLYRLEQF